MKKFRKITSVLLLFGFVFVLFSTIGLELAPHGRNAASEGWSFLGVEREALRNIHFVFGYAMLVLAAVHGIINAKPIIAYLKRDKTGFVPSATTVLATVGAGLLMALVFVNGAPQKTGTKTGHKAQKVEFSIHIAHN